MKKGWRVLLFALACSFATLACCSAAKADSGLYLFPLTSTSITVKAGKSVTLQAGMGINNGYSYTIQWRKSVSGTSGAIAYTAIDGAVGMSYTIDSVQEDASYVCVVTASDGCVQTARFTVRLDHRISMLLLEGQTVMVPVPSDAGNFVRAVTSESGIISVSSNTVRAVEQGTTTLNLEYRNRTISYAVEVLAADHLIYLPENLETVSAEAFRNAQSVRFAVLEPSVQVVQSGAFTDSGLQQIMVKGMDTSFEPQAFGALHPQIICPAGSEAERFAQESGYDYV